MTSFPRIFNAELAERLKGTYVITKAQLAALNGANEALILYVQAGCVPGKSMQIFTYLKWEIIINN